MISLCSTKLLVLNSTNLLKSTLTWILQLNSSNSQPPPREISLELIKCQIQICLFLAISKNSPLPAIIVAHTQPLSKCYLRWLNLEDGPLIFGWCDIYLDEAHFVMSDGIWRHDMHDMWFVMTGHLTFIYLQHLLSRVITCVPTARMAFESALAQLSLYPYLKILLR